MYKKLNLFWFLCFFTLLFVQSSIAGITLSIHNEIAESKNKLESLSDPKSKDPDSERQKQRITFYIKVLNSMESLSKKSDNDLKDGTFDSDIKKKIIRFIDVLYNQLPQATRKSSDKECKSPENQDIRPPSLKVLADIGADAKPDTEATPAKEDPKESKAEKPEEKPKEKKEENKEEEKRDPKKAKARHQIQFFPHKNGRVYLSLGEPLGHGGVMDYTIRYDCKTGIPVAHGEVRNPTKDQEHYAVRIERTAEQNLNTVLDSSGHVDFTGRIKHYYFGRNEVGSEFFPNTMNDYIYHHQKHKHLKRNKIWETKVMIQVSKFLQNLHKLKFRHSDIKPENIYINLNGERAVLGDYNQMGDPAKFLAKKIDLKTWYEASGTAGYSAPERVWQGDTLEEKIAFALGSDIFSLSTTFFNFTQSNLLPWFGKCHPKSPNFDPEFEACKERELDGFLKATPTVPRSCRSHLILLGLNKDPRQRPTATQYTKRLNQCLTRPSVTERTNEAKREEIAAYSGEFGITDYDMKAFHQLKSQKPGTYVLMTGQEQDRSGEAPNLYRLFLAYVDSNGSVQSTPLDVNPADPTQVREELEFYHETGILKDRLSLAGGLAGSGPVHSGPANSGPASAPARKSVKRSQAPESDDTLEDRDASESRNGAGTGDSVADADGSGAAPAAASPGASKKARTQ